MGSTLAIIQNIYGGMQFHKVKVRASLNEFLNGKQDYRFKRKMISTMAVLMFYIICILAMMAQSRECDTVGIRNYGIVTKPDINFQPESNGFFTKLLDLSVNSTDPAVKAEAERLISEWNAFASNTPFIFSLFAFLAFLCSCCLSGFTRRICLLTCVSLPTP
jgi:hypothetical protein